MPDIDDGETVEIQGSAKDPYILRNIGGVYSCTCPAWRNQSTAIEKRTCKHLRKYCGEDHVFEFSEVHQTSSGKLCWLEVT
jgi:DNA ligase-1